MARKSISGPAVFAIVLCSVCSLQAQKHRVNCKEQYQFSKTKVDLSADVLKKVSLSVKLDPQLLGQVDKWTTVVLAQESSLCNAYREADEKTFSTGTYLAELDKLRQWDDSFLEMVLGYVSTCDAKSQKGPSPEIEEQERKIKVDTERLIHNLPELKVPLKK